MKRQVLVNIHRGAGALALLTIISFFSSTVIAKLFGTVDQVTTVKAVIASLLPVMMMFMMITGATGKKLYPNKGKGVIGAKQLRMRIASMTGLLVMVPAAVYLYFKSEAGEFDAFFWSVQALELVGGAVNLTMISLNIRDGLSLKKSKKVRSEQPA
ncbi:hypothetical protein LRP49_15425 [Enterovibrio sp. ZSDZ35]|uniref:Transmembrane protein n=1 Tax=Enterovibrio qingdaonensis TaxID=2899818 RepID=A0ABT5QNJ5_9GAMM|nr:hypothetical protein [Enterovibrio sp. ZSDZ35]MDD1782562.1 hypothetical protein [Enterovibrio sp. ZSDZ35]